METSKSVRADKWLWAVRLYKTRSLAAAACNADRVQVSGQPVKPARTVRIGETMTAVTGHITRTFKVAGILARRVSAKEVPQYLEDLTPPEEYKKTPEPGFKPAGIRPKGAGRPTKKDRRELEHLWIELNQ